MKRAFSANTWKAAHRVALLQVSHCESVVWRDLRSEHEHSIKLRQPLSVLQSASRKTRCDQGYATTVRRETASENENLFYGFSINGDEVFCREGYESASGVLAHLDDVGALLAEMLELADLSRIEVHRPAEELEKFKAPLTHLNPAWFTLEAGLSR
jgi:hypothetical protein